MVLSLLAIAAYLAAGWACTRYSLLGLRRYGPLTTGDILAGVLGTLVLPFALGGALAAWIDRPVTERRPRNRSGWFWGVR